MAEQEKKRIFIVDDDEFIVNLVAMILADATTDSTQALPMIQAMRPDTVLVDLMMPGNCLGYRVRCGGRSICYVTDTELYLPESPYFDQHYAETLRQFVEGAEILITDCTYSDAEYATKAGWGHSCVSEVAKLANAARVKTLYLFHHDPDQDEDAIDAKLEEANEALAALGSDTNSISPAERLTVHL